MLAVSRFVLRHKLAVVVFWLAALAAGTVASAKLASRLSAQFALPGAASYRANQQILRAYGNGGPGYPEVAVVRLPPGQSAGNPAGRAALGRAFAAVARQPGLRVAGYASTGDRAFLGRDGRTSYGLVFTPYAGELEPPSLGPQITAVMRPLLPPGSQVAVTGMNELASGGQAREGFGVLAETLLAGVAALGVLLFVFGSALALLPLLMAAVAIPACFLALFGLAEVTTVSVIVQYLAALIGLGVAIDYSLLVVTRWREELAAGQGREQAVVRAMATAGRSVAFSGVTVALGLLSLIVLPVPALRSAGIGGMFVPAISVAVTLTLLPVLLATVGERADWPRRRLPAAASRAWTAWARLVVRRKWAAAIAAAAVLAALGVAAAGIKIGEPAARALGTTTPAAQTLRALQRAGVPAGVLDPIEILVPAPAAPGVADRLAAEPGIRTAAAPTGPAWRRGGTALISVQPVAEPSTPAGAVTIARVRRAAATAAGAMTGGPGVLLLDENHTFYGRFPLLLAVLAAVTVVLLARAFGSLLLPLKAVVLNLASVGATYGVLVLVWQHGHGSQLIWGLPATGAITNWVPLTAFAFLFGLSMDYEVFILSRVREERDRTGSTATGIIAGIGRTGRLVTGAALILFFAFAALSTGPETDLKVMATALGAGILLDATVVRALLVPALAALFGEWNWRLPRAARRLLHVPVPPPASAAPHHPKLAGATGGHMVPNGPSGGGWTAMAAEVARRAMHDDMERARLAFHQLLNQATPADLRRRSAGTKWTNEQLLFHMLFGYLVVRALLVLVRVFGALPDGASKAFAWLLDCARSPFHVINYLGSCAGARVIPARRMAVVLDRVIAALQQRLGREPEAALRRGMHFPTTWDPFFRDYMTLAEVYQYPTKHLGFHQRQLTLTSTK
jgi:putative drug exporter of the RND superfamily